MCKNEKLERWGALITWAELVNWYVLCYVLRQRGDSPAERYYQILECTGLYFEVLTLLSFFPDAKFNFFR